MHSMAQDLHYIIVHQHATQMVYKLERHEAYQTRVVPIVYRVYVKLANASMHSEYTTDNAVNHQAQLKEEAEYHSW